MLEIIPKEADCHISALTVLAIILVSVWGRLFCISQLTAPQYAVNPESTACKTVASILSQGTTFYNRQRPPHSYLDSIVAVALNSLLGLLNTREYRMKMLQNQGTNDELPISTVVVPTSIHFASMPLSAGSTNASIWSQSSGEHYMGVSLNCIFI